MSQVSMTGVVPKIQNSNRAPAQGSHPKRRLQQSPGEANLLHQEQAKRPPGAAGLLTGSKSRTGSTEGRQAGP